MQARAGRNSVIGSVGDDRARVRRHRSGCRSRRDGAPTRGGGICGFVTKALPPLRCCYYCYHHHHNHYREAYIVIKRGGYAVSRRTGNRAVPRTDARGPDCNDLNAPGRRAIPRLVRARVCVLDTCKLYVVPVVTRVWSCGVCARVAV